MATIPMTSGFTLIPEGTHIFRIYKVDYNEEFGKITVHLVNAQGITHQERFSLIGNGGVINESACNAFSYFAKTALNNFDLEEIDHTWLVNRYIKATVVHTVSPKKDDPTKTVTFANLDRDKAPAEGFDTTPVPKALNLGNESDQGGDAAPASAPAANPAPATTGGLDLDALLN